MTSTPPSPPPADAGPEASPARAHESPATPSADAPTPGVPRLPSLRAAAVLAAGMLALGVAVGAAIGPAPDASFAGPADLPALLPALTALASSGSSANRATPPAPPAVESEATPAVAPSAAEAPAQSASVVVRRAVPSTSSASASAPAAAEGGESGAKGGEGSNPSSSSKLPAVTNVWLIELAGSTFTQALAQATSAPYINSQLRTGTLLSGWSALDASAFASDAPLLTGKPPQLLDTIVQPPCPEGVAGAQCAPETAGALGAADSFLQQTLPTITSSVAYRERGLIVITFGAVGNATASGLAAGAATATLSAEPPAGALLLSPFDRAGARPTIAFNPTSPKRSTEALLHR